jgi:hypothetical protein
MQQKAEVLELQQKTQQHEPIDQKWLADKEKKIKRLDKEEKETVARTMWERGRLLSEVRLKIRNNEGFVKWVEGRFEYSVATAYNHIAIYVGCPKHELLDCFPLWLLRKIGSSNCPKELRKLIQDNAERLRKDLKEKVYREIEDKVRKLGFDLDGSAFNQLFEKRKDEARQYEYIWKNEKDLDEVERWWNGFDAVATAWLDPDDDGIVRLTEEQAKRWIVSKLQELGYPLEYELFVENDVSND